MVPTKNKTLPTAPYHTDSHESSWKSRKVMCMGFDASRKQNDRHLKALSYDGWVRCSTPGRAVLRRGCISLSGSTETAPPRKTITPNLCFASGEGHAPSRPYQKFESGPVNHTGWFASTKFSVLIGGSGGRNSCLIARAGARGSQEFGVRLLFSSEGTSSPQANKTLTFRRNNLFTRA